MGFLPRLGCDAKKIDANVYTLFVPANSCAVNGCGMFIFPIVVVMSIFPSRETALPNFLLGLVFIKLTLVFTYFFLKVGGLIGTAAMMKVVTNPDLASNLNTDSLCGLASATLPDVYRGTCGSALLAYVVTFNDKAGIRSLGFHSFGAQQMLSTGPGQAGAAAVLARGGASLLLPL